MSFFKAISQEKSFDIQGHRGCRGYMPENTIPAFIHAVGMNVSTLEMDVVITKDRKVLVSHEPWISQEICLDTNGQKLHLKNENELNIFKMNYGEVRQYDCGSLFVNRFPDQQKSKVHKPLLSDVIDTIKSYCTENRISIPEFNIEIKSDIQYDVIYTPPFNEFCELVISVISEKSIQPLCIIQSFDMRVLKYFHQNYPGIRLAFLTEEKSDVNTFIEKLGFAPEIFSPDKDLINREMIEELHSKNVKLIPWTVNDEIKIKELILLGVDGIITDYPDRVRKVLGKISR